MEITIDKQNLTPRIKKTGVLVYSELTNTLFIKSKNKGVMQIGSSFSSGDFVEKSTTIDINGVVQDLSTSRTWTIFVPTKTSELTNDSGFITTTDLSSYLTITSAAATYQPIGSYLTSISGLNISQLTNDSGYITSSALTGYVPTSRTITINGTTQDLSSNRSWSVGTVTDVAALTLGTTGTDLSSSVATGTTTPVITLNVPTASATNRGALSSTDWSTFNNKFTLPSLTAGSVLFSNGTTIAQDNANFFWDGTNKRLYIGSTSPTTFKVNIYDASSASLNVQTTLHQGLLFASNGASAIGFGSQTVTDFIIRTSGVERARIKANGAFGIGVTSATAVLHLKAGTATAGTAPIKLTAGTNLTTPENGAFEFDGTNLYFTVGGVRKTVTLV